MNKELKSRRELLSPPGDTIQETIDIIGMNQYELAERIGKNIKNVNRIIKGKESISPETALALERVLNISADFWLERERLFQIEKAKLEFDEEIEKNKSWIKNFPIAEMIKLEWIPFNNEAILILKDLLKFFFSSCENRKTVVSLHRFKKAHCLSHGVMVALLILVQSV